jgi:hypothetical protein
LADRRSYVAGQRVDIDFQPERQRSRRLEARADAAELFARNRLIQMQCVAPERLVAERIEAERLPARGDRLQRLLSELLVGERRATFACASSSEWASR